MSVIWVCCSFYIIQIPPPVIWSILTLRIKPINMLLTFVKIENDLKVSLF